MDLDEFRSILQNSDVGIWGFIDSAIQLASIDFGDELRTRRDGIVAKLFANSGSGCPNCETGDKGGEVVKAGGNHSPYTPVSINGDDDEENEQVHHDDQDRRGRFVDDGGDGGDDDEDVDDEQRRILSIKDQLEDPHQLDDSMVDLLQTLADMDITFKALKETDIGRHVNRLRKHPSGEVRQLVKLLVRKWKDLVDDWVRLNASGEIQSSNNLIVDGDSPLQNIPKNKQNGPHSQVPDFAYSPNPYNGSSGSDRNNSEPEPKSRASTLATPPPRRDPPAKHTKSPSASLSAPPPNRKKEVAIDPDRFASARKRLQENYQEAQNAKKQRTIQVMDIHEIPKPKNSYFPKNKGGFQRH